MEMNGNSTNGVDQSTNFLKGIVTRLFPRFKGSTHPIMKNQSGRFPDQGNVTMMPFSDYIAKHETSGTLSSSHFGALKAIEQNASAGTPPSLPTICVTGRPIPEISLDCYLALQARNQPNPFLFTRSGLWITVEHDDQGASRIKAVDDDILRSTLARSATFVRSDGTTLVPSPHLSVIRDLLKSPDYKSLPSLNGVITCPTISARGSVLCEPGYNPEAKLYLSLSEDMRNIVVPPHPTNQDIQDAVEVITDLFSDFPFKDQASLANAIGLLITTIIRLAIKGNVPIALIDAPQKGTGKTLIAAMIYQIYSGQEAAMTSAPTGPEEWNKKITSFLKRGERIVILDNLDDPLSSQDLASVLTSQAWQDRLLGQNEIIKLPHEVVWMATGNNIRIGGDLGRRSYWIRLDAKMSTPWLGRSFRHENLPQFIMENRARIITACLTLAKGWYEADSPPPKTPILGSFESWSKVIGGILEFSGVNGFLGNNDELQKKVDTETAEWEQFLLSVSENFFPDKQFSVSQLLDCLNKNLELRGLIPDALFPSTKKGPGSLDAQSLGIAFKRIEGVRFGDSSVRIRKVDNAETRNHANYWVIERD